MKFNTLVTSIEQIHNHFQSQTAKAINISLTLRNWLIGFYIVEFEQNGEERAKYGEKLLSKLSERCKHIKGMDERSFRNFRTLYQFYPQIQAVIVKELSQIPIRGSLTPELKTHYNGLNAALILSKLSYTHLEQLLKLDDGLKRNFYEIECIKGSWSVRELKRQIHSLYFERSGMSLKPELLSEIIQQKAENFSPQDIIKSVYAFEFLGLKTKDAVEETDLETALLDHLQEFIMEMGNGFCFEARQKRILIDDEYYFIDLVFYHRILKCHILVELKIDQFKHEQLSQLNTYVSYYREEIKRTDDNAPIGILLCTEKGKKLVEYALSGMDEHLFVSKYLLELPRKEILEAFIQQEMKKWNE